MTVFIDSGVFIGAYNKRDTYHQEASDLLRRILKREYGSSYTSWYILDETVTYIRKKQERKGKAINLGKNILHSESLEILRVGIDDL